MEFICPKGHQTECRHNDAMITCDCGLQAIQSHIAGGTYPLKPTPPAQIVRIGAKQFQPDPIVIRS